MSRVLRGLLAFLGVLFGGVLVLGLLLWWLAQRERGQRELQVIEIKIPTESPIGEPQQEAVAGAPGEAEAEASLGPEGEPGLEPEPDDLRRIEGIGPKISRVLQAAGIRTFAGLAATEVEEIERILEAEDPRLRRLADPGTWPEQARLAADGDWEGLAALQAQLKGGRRVAS